MIRMGHGLEAQFQLRPVHFFRGFSSLVPTLSEKNGNTIPLVELARFLTPHMHNRHFELHHAETGALLDCLAQHATKWPKRDPKVA